MTAILTKIVIISSAADPYLQSFEELFGDGYSILGTEQVAAPHPFPSVLHNGRHELYRERQNQNPVNLGNQLPGRFC